MHVPNDQLPAEKLGDYEGRMQQFDDYYVNFETIPAGLGGRELFKGLPDDACRRSGHAWPVISFNLPLYAPNCSELKFSEIHIQDPA